MLLAMSILLSSNAWTQESNFDSSADKSVVQEKTAGKKKGKRAQRTVVNQKKRIVQNVTKSLRKVELTETQKKKLAELVDEKFDAVAKIVSQLNALEPGDVHKKRMAAMKAAKKEGLKREAIVAAGFKEAGVSEGDQAKILELAKSRTKIMNSIRKSLVATFSEEQKEKFDAGKKKASSEGKNKNGKGKKGKGKNKQSDGESGKGA